MEYLFLALSYAPFAVAAGVGLALPALLVGAYSNFAVGLWLIATTFVLEAVNMSQPFLRVGLTLYVPDIPLALIAAAAGLRWLLSDAVPRRHPAWAVLVLVFLLGLAYGLVRHGTGAGVQARPMFYALAAASYALTFPIGERELRHLVRAMLVAGCALMALVAYRWLVYFLPLRDLLPPGGTYNIDGPIRVVGANWSMLLAATFVCAVFFARPLGSTGTLRLAAPLLLAFVLLLQHRSVWLGLIGATLMALLVARAQRVPLWQQVALLIAMATTAAAPLLFSQTLSSQVQRSATTAITGQGTVEARFENWQATIEQWWGEGNRVRLLGREPGASTVREIETDTGTLKIAFGAHNNYVDALTRLGLIGFVALLAFYAYVLRGLVRLHRQRLPDAPFTALLLVLLAGQLVFHVAYQADYMGFLAFGVAGAWVAGHARAAGRSAPATARPERRAARHPPWPRPAGRPARS
jgi:O-antigen ligase